MPPTQPHAAGPADGTATRQSGRPEKHVHHGRTPAAWVGSLTATLAIILGGVGMVTANWTLVWIAAGLLVMAAILTRVLQVMGHGAD